MTAPLSPEQIAECVLPRKGGRGHSYDFMGVRVGRLTVVAENGRDRWQRVLWMCACDCGGSRTVSSVDLRSGYVTSCGCGNDKTHGGEKRTRHGCAKRQARSPEYNVWRNMKARCLSPSRRDYKTYGGRGISVCVRWLESFESFMVDMGPRPTPDHSIDRIDVDGNYEPGNCRWVTWAEQSANKRKPVLTPEQRRSAALESCRRYRGKKRAALEAPAVGAQDGA